MEHWKPVVGYETLYQVSDLGRVRTIKTGRLKKASVDKHDGRCFLLLWSNNRYKLMRVARLVLFAFRGSPLSGQECCHNDGDTSNNHLSNLRWDTASANQNDRAKHGTSNRGEQCAAAKLTTADVLAIRADPRLQREIAADYAVLQNTISRIKARKRWAHI